MRFDSLYSASKLHNARFLFFLVSFCLFLYPISIDGNSANYSFIVLPAASALLTLTIKKPSDELVLLMGLYVVIFVVASIYQYHLIDEWPRRVISFILFMSMFAFVFMNIDQSMFEAFKSALVVMSIYFSLVAVYEWYMYGGPNLSFEAKDLVGSQRFGFIYIMAFWLVYLSRPHGLSIWALKQVALVIILIGMVLTFSRATIVALLASYIVFFVVSLKNQSNASVFRKVKKLALFSLGTFLMLTLIITLFPVTFEFFEARLFERLLDPDFVFYMAVSDTSEGARIFLWKSILEFVLHHPLTGSGYLGVWAFPALNEIGGSAHSQYMDVLFRVGIIGFAIHMFLLYRTGKCLRVVDSGLYWGFIGVLVYGLFHETFKESHGGFVLAFLLGVIFRRGRSVVITEG